MVIRSPYGGGIFGGQTHSQSPEAFFAHMPGIKTVIPSNPYDAKGLLIAAIEDNDPVVFFEPKRIYNGPFDGFYERPVTPWAKHPAAEVPDGHYTVPLGKAAVAREGNDVTILAYGTMVHVALATAEARGHRRRGDRPAHHRPGRHRDDRGIGQEDRPLRRHPRGDADRGLRRRAVALWCRSAASIISRRRCSASPATTRPIRIRWNGPISRARRGSARR